MPGFSKECGITSHHFYRSFCTPQNLKLRDSRKLPDISAGENISRRGKPWSLRGLILNELCGSKVFCWPSTSNEHFWCRSLNQWPHQLHVMTWSELHMLHSQQQASEARHTKTDVQKDCSRKSKGPACDIRCFCIAAAFHLNNYCGSPALCLWYKRDGGLRRCFTVTFMWHRSTWSTLYSKFVTLQTFMDPVQKSHTSALNVAPMALHFLTSVFIVWINIIEKYVHFLLTAIELSSVRENGIVTLTIQLLMCSFCKAAAVLPAFYCFPSAPFSIETHSVIGPSAPIQKEKRTAETYYCFPSASYYLCIELFLTT